MATLTQLLQDAVRSGDEQALEMVTAVLLADDQQDMSAYPHVAEAMADTEEDYLSAVAVELRERWRQTRAAALLWVAGGFAHHADHPAATAMGGLLMEALVWGLENDDGDAVREALYALISGDWPLAVTACHIAAGHPQTSVDMRDYATAHLRFEAAAAAYEAERASALVAAWYPEL